MAISIPAPAAVAAADLPHPRLRAGHRARIRVEAGHLRGIVTNAVWLAIETVVVPTVLLLVAMSTVGAMGGLWAVLGWRLGAVLVRCVRARRIPTAVVLSSSIFTARTVVSLLVGSMYMYLLQPIVMTASVSVLWAVSALWVRPIPLRLVADFVHLPEAMTSDPVVRRLFGQVGLWWAGVHLIACAAGFVALQHSATAAVAWGGVFSLVSTITSTGLCVGWAWRGLRRLPVTEIRVGAPTHERSACGHMLRDAVKKAPRCGGCRTVLGPVAAG